MLLDVLNVIWATTHVMTQITLLPDQYFPYPVEREGITAMSFHREFWRSDSDCSFKGVMVPFTRDWDEEVDNIYSKSVIPAEPDKTAGHAFLVNKKVCPGKEPEDIFRVDSTTRVRIERVRQTHVHDRTIAAFDLTAMRQDQQPKWFAQVMSRIERLAAADNPVAKNFLAELKAAAERKAPGAPTQEHHISP